MSSVYKYHWVNRVPMEDIALSTLVRMNGKDTEAYQYTEYTHWLLHVYKVMGGCSYVFECVPVDEHGCYEDDYPMFTLETDEGIDMDVLVGTYQAFVSDAMKGTLDSELN